MSISRGLRLGMTGWLLAGALACGGEDTAATDATTEPGANDVAQDGVPTDVGDPGMTEFPVHEAIDSPKVAVNEVVHNATGKASVDWVEFYNPGTDAVDLSGWKLKDSKDTHIFVFPQGTTIAAGGFLLAYGKGGTSALTFTFGLGDADSVRLFQVDGQLIDSVSWMLGEAPSGMSLGRYPDGHGPFYTLPTPTPGDHNVAPK